VSAEEMAMMIEPPEGDDMQRERTTDLIQDFWRGVA